LIRTERHGEDEVENPIRLLENCFVGTQNMDITMLLDPPKQLELELISIS
jgi:hypothetical protein